MIEASNLVPDGGYFATWDLLTRREMMPAAASTANPASEIMNFNVKLHVSYQPGYLFDLFYFVDSTAMKEQI